MSPASWVRRLEPVQPNGPRLSCGALKKDSFPNLRAPSASSAGFLFSPPPAHLLVVSRLSAGPRAHPRRRRAEMRFYNRQHRHYCGIDLHVKTMYLCILDAAGQVLVHRNVKSTREAFLETVAPYREDLVVAAECMFTWYWLADVCAAEAIPFVLGHALAMKAIHGGKAKNDKIDSRKIAGLLRGGLLPQAYVYPAAMRSTRDLLRRRLHLVRKRGQLLAHIQNTRAQYQLPEFGRRLAYPANRSGVSELFSDPSVRKSIDVDLAVLERYDELITDLELTIVREAKRHDGDAFHRLRSVPGIGKVLALPILYEIHDVTRFDRVQEFASYARLVKGKKQSGGK